MFSISKPNKKAETSPLKTIVNIATIASTVITCLRLVIYGVFSIKTAAWVMIAVVVFVAIGNNISKVMLAGAAVILFCLLYSSGSAAGFQAMLTGVLALRLVLVGLYFILKGLFSHSR